VGRKLRPYNKLVRTAGNKNDVILLKVFKDLSVCIVRKESRARVGDNRFSVVRKIGGHNLYRGEGGK
jgi:hypothetical protein